MTADHSDNEKRLGWLAMQWGGVALQLRVLESVAGFYLGTHDDEGPYSRESEEYWKTREEAEAALNGSSMNSWTQRLAP